jgi:hypothetical protein
MRLGNLGSFGGPGLLFVFSDFGTGVIDFDEQPDRVVGAIAILTGGIFEGGIGLADFLFEVLIEFEKAGGVLFVSGGKPEGTNRESFINHEVTRNEAGFLRLKLGDKCLAIGHAPLVPGTVKLFVDGIQRFKVRAGAGSAAENFGLLNLLNGSITGVNVQAVGRLFQTLAILLLGFSQEKRIVIGDIIQLVDEGGQFRFESGQIDGRLSEEIEIDSEECEEEADCSDSDAEPLRAGFEGRGCRFFEFRRRSLPAELGSAPGFGGQLEPGRAAFLDRIRNGHDGVGAGSEESVFVEVSAFGAKQRDGLANGERASHGSGRSELMVETRGGEQFVVAGGRAHHELQALFRTFIFLKVMIKLAQEHEGRKVGTMGLEQRFETLTRFLVLIGFNQTSDGLKVSFFINVTPLELKLCALGERTEKPDNIWNQCQN